MEKERREIRIITGEPLEPSVAIIRRAFRTVAEEMDFTEENAPTHPSFMTVPRLEDTRRKGAIFWGLFINNQQAGFVAVEKTNDGKYCMERLAVLPEFRHRGNGKVLVDTAISYARSQGGKKLYIGMVNEHTVLKNWYLAMGFKEISVQKFEHLPFTVAFMELDL